MVQENRERYYSLDSLKAVCALLVIFIHCKYPYREAVLPITDVAVPLFFAISGYCLYGAKRNWKRIDRIGLIFAWTFILYLTKTEIFHLMTTHQWFMPSVDSIMNLLLFNDVVFAIHLWYLPAYLYVLVIAYFIDKYNLWKAAFCLIIPLLLIGGYIKYSIADTCPENIFYYRNTYFNGLPFFLLGALVKCINTVKVKNVILLIWGGNFLVFRYLTIVSGLIGIVVKDVDLLCLVFVLFILVTHIRQTKDNILSKLGRSYSLYIYIFHLMIISIMEMTATHLPAGLYDAYMYINPICVLLLSIALTSLLAKLRVIKI